MEHPVLVGWTGNTAGNGTLNMYDIPKSPMPPGLLPSAQAQNSVGNVVMGTGSGSTETPSISVADAYIGNGGAGTMVMYGASTLSASDEVVVGAEDAENGTTGLGTLALADASQVQVGDLTDGGRIPALRVLERFCRRGQRRHPPQFRYL